MRRKPGRPKNPKGTRSVSISLRINEKLLRDLKQAAAESGQGVFAREVMQRLRASLLAQGLYNEEIRGLSYLFERALNVLPGGKLMKDPWRFRAFTGAVAAILA